MPKARFYAPPLQFLCRDGYGDMDSQEQQLHNTVRTDKRTREYLRKSVKGREDMYLDLTKTLLQQNGENADDESSTTSNISTSSTNTVTEKRKRHRVAA